MDIRIYKFFVLFSLFYMCKSDEDFDVFRKLSEVNKQWLQMTSIPEAARLLQHPPYSYHLEGDPANYLNISELFTKNVGDDVSSKDTGKCSDDLIQIVFNIGSQWALQMLDSNGKLTGGLLRGGLIWTGHYSECIDVYSPKDENGHGDFHGQYCVAALSMNFGEKYSNLPLTIGICIPDSCSADNIETALRNVSRILDSNSTDHFPVLKKYISMLSLKSFSCKLKTKSMDIASIIYLTIVVGFVFLSIIGTAVGVIDNWKLRSVSRIIISHEDVPHHEKEISHASSRSNNHAVISGAKGELRGEHSGINSPEKEISDDKAILVQNDALVMQSVEMHSKRPVYHLLKNILLCFSVVKNGEKILNTDGADGQLLSIHGIRFLSLSWVILGHTYITAVPIIGNRLDVLKDIDSFLFQMLLQSPFSVDSFFVLSGFLLGYLFLKEATKKNGKINWIYFYVHRFWRLTPAYMVAVFFYMLIFKYLGSGPFWDDENCDANRSTWWKYLLYINNFIPIHEMCVGWSWYLANDMQFYIISPLFLYPLWRWPAVGFSILGALLIGTWTTTGILSYQYDLIPMFVGATQITDFSKYEERMWFSFNKIYDKPYCRIAPHIIGVILSYILHIVNQRKNFLNWWQQLLGWIVAAFCSLSVVFGLYHVEMSKTTALFYNALCRSSFSIGLCWLIFVCETGHGGFLTKLLSWKLWIPLSRLTYCAYLIHPILIHGYYQTYQTALYFTQLVAVTNFMGFLLMSYGLAFLFSVTFESPLMNLEKLVLKNKHK